MKHSLFAFNIIILDIIIYNDEMNKASRNEKKEKKKRKKIENSFQKANLKIVKIFKNNPYR